MSAVIENGPAAPTAATINLTTYGTYYERILLDAPSTQGAEDDQEHADDDSLDNPVHPILAVDKIEGMRYEVLKPSLQLAWLLLLSPGSLEYLYAAMLAPLRDVPYADSAPESTRTFKSIFRKEDSLTATDIAQIEAKLLQLEPLLTFRKMTGEHDTARGMCNPCFDVKADAICSLDGTPWKGCGSTIMLSADLYARLCTLYDSVSAGDNDKRDEYLFASASVAKTVCHELAHAVEIARFGYGDVVVGFEDQYMSEEGLDFENVVFGGILRLYRRKANLVDYPSPQVFDRYTSVKNKGGKMFVACPPELDVEVVWKIPNSYITSLFRKSFWEDTVAQQGGEALRVPKLVGYRNLPCAERGVCKCYDCQCTEAIVSALVESGNRALDHKALVGTLKKIWRRFQKRCAKEKQKNGCTCSARPTPAAPGKDGSRASGANNPQGERTTSDAAPATPAKSYRHPAREFFLTHCARLDWGPWPWGKWDTRLHGASKDPQTYGVPEGYVSLLDGSLVPAHQAEELLARERADIEPNIAFLKAYVERVRRGEADGSLQWRGEEERLKYRRQLPALLEIIESDDPAVRRLVAAIPGVG